MQNILISIGKAILNIIYLFFKLFKIKNKIVFISRQFDFPNLDFILIKKELEKQKIEIETVFLCKKLRNGILNKIKYIGFMFKCMKHLATSKICVIDTYVIPVSLLKHKKNLKIIQIWHSLAAIKQFGHQTINKKAGAKRRYCKEYEYA